MSIPDCLQLHVKNQFIRDICKLRTIATIALKQIDERQSMLDSATLCLDQQNKLIKHFENERNELLTDLNKTITERTRELTNIKQIDDYEEKQIIERRLTKLTKQLEELENPKPIEKKQKKKKKKALTIKTVEKPTRWR